MGDSGMRVAFEFAVPHRGAWRDMNPDGIFANFCQNAGMELRSGPRPIPPTPTNFWRQLAFGVYWPDPG